MIFWDFLLPYAQTAMQMIGGGVITALTLYATQQPIDPHAIVGGMLSTIIPYRATPPKFPRND